MIGGCPVTHACSPDPRQELGPPSDADAWQGLSAADTLRSLIMHRKDQSKRAAQLRSELRLSDALFYNVKVRALAARAAATPGDDWSALWAFANERKSPIGCEPVGAVLLPAARWSRPDLPSGLPLHCFGRPSPPADRPFVDACVAAGRNLDARRYAAKVDDYDEKVDLLVQLGAFSDAAELALKHKDAARLQAMAESGAEMTPAAQDIIERALATLVKRR